MFRGEAVSALVVAAGQSRRMSGQDKLFSSLDGVPLLAQTVEGFFLTPVDGILVVLRQECLPIGQRMAQERGWTGLVRFCRGGPRRQDSVRLGLEEIVGEGWVLIHDGARPLFTPALVHQGLEAAAATGAAVPGIPLPDTVKLISPTGMVERTLPRDQLRAVQTPQVFRLTLIREAHRHFAQSTQFFTDDAALLEALGHPISLFPGEPHNIKITRQEDLQWAEVLWAARKEG